jgi:hypothetical protein
MATDPGLPASGHEVGHEARVILEDVLFLHEPARSAPAGRPVEHAVGREARELLGAVRVLERIEVVLRPGSPVRHEQRRRVDAPALDEEPHVILVHGVDGNRVLETRIPVDGLRQVLLDVQRAFGGRHHAMLTRRLDDPLTLLPRAGHVHLERLRIEVLGVAPHEVTRLLEGIDVELEEDAGTGGVDPRPHDLTGAHLIFVGEHVVLLVWGSRVVVTPYARFAKYGHASPRWTEKDGRRWACASTKPGTIVRPTGPRPRRRTGPPRLHARRPPRCGCPGPPRPRPRRPRRRSW